MAIKNLAPRDANSSGRIIKNMRICGSGLYEYATSEAALMGLEIPGDYKDPTFFIYRSPEVLNANKDLYARVPIITGHHVRVTTANAKQLAVGMVGDTVKSEIGDDGETYLYTTGTIITGDGIEAYERFGELSVGYDPIVKWKPGVHKGQPYQAVLEGFNEINHLLICKTARGGHQCMIMDEQPWGLNILNGGKDMGILSKIFGGGKPMTGDAQVVSTLLQSISAGADPEVQVAKIRGMIGDCKDSTFTDYLNELAGARKAGADEKTLCRAVDIVDAYYKTKIAGDEKKEEPKKEEPKKEEPKKEEPASKEEPKKDDKEPVKEPAKQTGDAVDYDRIQKMIGDTVSAALAAALPKKEEPVAGDEAQVKEFNIAITGDANKGATSDDVMKNIF